MSGLVQAVSNPQKGPDGGLKIPALAGCAQRRRDFIDMPRRRRRKQAAPGSGAQTRIIGNWDRSARPAKLKMLGRISIDGEMPGGAVGFACRALVSASFTQTPG